MPRTSRSVAQRLAAQHSAKSKKRRAPRPTDAAPAQGTPASDTPSSSVSVDQILDEVVPSAGGSRTASTPTLVSTATRSATGSAAARKPGTLGRASSRLGARPPVTRRRFSEYAEEYRYVWTDLRRVLVVAGGLALALIVLAVFID
jgi:hypothetical protein